MPRLEIIESHTADATSSIATIRGPRGSGRTTELIKRMARQPGSVIVVANMGRLRESADMAKELAADVRFITVSHLDRLAGFHGRVGVDNIDRLSWHHVMNLARYRPRIVAVTEER